MKQNSSSPSTTNSSETQQQQQPKKKIVERLSSAVFSGLRSFPLPDLDEDSKAMISELISPPPLSDDDYEEEEEGESELEDSDDDFARGGATTAAATTATTMATAAFFDDTLDSSSRKKKASSSPPALGARGGGWVLAQFAALFFVVFPPTAITLAIQVSGIFAILAGIALAAAGVGSIGVRSLSPFPVPRRSNQLAEKGAYALVRHPMYGGLILFASGAAAASASPGRAAAALALFLILENKMLIEEKWMRKKHGASYDAYAARTRKAIPFLW